MLTKLRRVRTIAIGSSVVAAALLLPPVMSAQRPDFDRQEQRRDRNDWDWDGNYTRLTRIPAGSYISIRTTQSIRSDRDGGVYPALVAEDVWDNYGRLSVPAIPEGSRVDLVVRRARDGDLILDLQNIYAHGQVYAVNAQPERVEGSERRGDAGDTAQWVGGGAVIGSIIGAIAGGGKGAAIGAGAGAATGLGAMAYQGRSIRIPANARLEFRLNNGIDMRTSGRNYRDDDRRRR